MTLFDHPERCHSSNFPRTSAANRSRRPPSHRLNQRRSPFITPEVLVSLLLVFMRSASLVNAQIGVTLCACQPVAYTFQLRFNNFCNQSNIEGPGVEDWDCKTTSSDSTATDFTPALITRAEVKELDQDQNVINFQNYAGPFFDGDTFTYVSIAANPSNVNSTTLPKGLQLSVYGRNIEEQDILNFWIILFTNECGLFPVLDPGEQIGWTDLLGLQRPNVTLCPAASFPPTFAPTTAIPTSAPTIAPTLSQKPTRVKTDAPTTTAMPTSSPSCVPSSTPSLHSPTFRPTRKGKGSGKKKSKAPKSKKTKGPSKGKGKGKGGKTKAPSSAGKSKGKGSVSSKAPSSGKGKGGLSTKRPSSGKGGMSGSYGEDRVYALSTFNFAEYMSVVYPSKKKSGSKKNAPKKKSKGHKRTRGPTRQPSVCVEHEPIMKKKSKSEKRPPKLKAKHSIPAAKKKKVISKSKKHSKLTKPTSSGKGSSKEKAPTVPVRSSSSKTGKGSPKEAASNIPIKNSSSKTGKGGKGGSKQSPPTVVSPSADATIVLSADLTSPISPTAYQMSSKNAKAPSVSQSPTASPTGQRPGTRRYRLTRQ